MILRSTFLALLLCGLSPQHLSAQEPTAVMSLNDCMVYAVDHSYETQRAQNSLDNNKLDYTGAILDHLPSLSASVSGTTSFGRGIDPATNSYVNTSTFSNGLSSSASVPVFYGMRLLNSTRYYKISRLKGEESLKQQQDLTAQQVMVAYAEVVYNQELVALYQDQLESYEQSEKLAARKYELGNGSPTDLYEIQASVCSQQYNVITAQNNLEQSIIKLKDLMNFPLSDSLLIEPKIPETMLFDQDQELKAITAYAQANNSSAIISEYALTQSKLTLSIAKASFYPSVSLWANIYTSYYTNLDDRDITITPYADQLSDNMGKGVGASISIPIFSGLDTRLNVQKQRNNLRQAERDHSENLRELESLIKQSVMDLEASRAKYHTSQMNVKHQRTANQANQKKYQAGLLSIIDLLTSNNNLLLAQIELRNAYLRYQIQLRQVNFYKGIPYIQ